MSVEMILGTVAFGVLTVMWVVLPSFLHRGNKESK